METVHTGMLSNPKMFSLVNRLKAEAQKHNIAITIDGIVSPGQLSSDIQHLAATTRATAAGLSARRNSYTISARESADFHRALAELDVAAVCRRLWNAASLADCKMMYFRIEIKDGKAEIHWSK